MLRSTARLMSKIFRSNNGIDLHLKLPHSFSRRQFRKFSSVPQITCTYRQIFITDKKWRSYPQEIRDELNKNIFYQIEGMDNHGGIQDGMYDHLNQIVRDGYLNFDKYVLMPNHSRTALLNLLWHSSAYDITGGIWALKENLFTIEEFLSFTKDCQDELIGILEKPVKDYYTHVDLTKAQKIEMILLTLNKFKESDLARRWNEGRIPEVQDDKSISQEELDRINKQSESFSSSTIKWEFDTYRSLYFYRVNTENPSIENNKSDPQPIKETDDMVVFSLNKKQGK